MVRISFQIIDLKKKNKIRKKNQYMFIFLIYIQKKNKFNSIFFKNYYYYIYFFLKLNPFKIHKKIEINLKKNGYE